MHQQAILVTERNASEIAETLIDYSAQDILDEITPILNRGMRAVLVRSSVGADYVVSHIISESMFYANAKPAVPLHEADYFTRVTQL